MQGCERHRTGTGPRLPGVGVRWSSAWTKTLRTGEGPETSRQRKSRSLGRETQGRRFAVRSSYSTSTWRIPFQPRGPKFPSSL